MEFGLPRGLTPRGTDTVGSQAYALHAGVNLLGGTCLFWLLALAAWFLFRRISGAFHTPLATSALLLASALECLLALAAAELLCLRTDQPVSPLRRAVIWLPVVSLVMVAGTLSIPGSPWIGLVGLWSTVAIAAAWIVVRSRRLSSPTEPGERPRSPTTLQPDDCPPPWLVADSFAGDDDDAETLPDNVDQQLTRGRDDAGRIYVQGVARVVLPAGHRSANLHIAICPPLTEPPQVQVEQVAGPAATVRVGMALPQGVRFEVRRLETIDAAESVVMEFYAR